MPYMSDYRAIELLILCAIAAAGVDYVPVSVEFIFNSSVAVQCQVIQVTSDAILEIDEIFFVNLVVSDADVLLENDTVTVIIENDDRKLYLES